MCLANLELGELVRKYLEVFLSPQITICVTVAVFIFLFRESLSRLIDRIGKISFAGLDLAAEQPEPLPKPEEGSASEPSVDPESLGRESLEQLVEDLRTVKDYWEYSFLSVFLIPRTKDVLRMIANNPIERSLFYAWLALVLKLDNEQQKATVDALTNYGLITFSDNHFRATDKGLEFLRREQLLRDEPVPYRNPPRSTDPA